MLTLDSQQLATQRRRTELLKRQDDQRRALRANIDSKEVTVAKDGDLTTTSLSEQLGQPLSSAEFIRRLERMNQKFVFEVANADPSKMGIYVIENRRQPTGHMEQVKRFVTGMQRGFMPERSVRHMRKERVADPDIQGAWRTVDVFYKETRGWRTVLKTLLRERLITQGQIDRYFPVNLNSKNWQILTT